MCEQEELRGRINAILTSKNVSIYSLCKEKSKRNTLTRQIMHNTMISADTIELILSTFPDVSAEWLLRGEGEMDKASHYSQNIYASNGSIVQSGANRGDATISHDKDSEVESLRSIIAELRQDKKTLTMLLESLTQMKK